MKNRKPLGRRHLLRSRRGERHRTGIVDSPWRPPPAAIITASGETLVSRGRGGTLSSPLAVTSRLLAGGSFDDSTNGHRADDYAAAPSAPMSQPTSASLLEGADARTTVPTTEPLGLRARYCAARANPDLAYSRIRRRLAAAVRRRGLTASSRLLGAPSRRHVGKRGPAPSPPAAEEAEIRDASCGWPLDAEYAPGYAMAYFIRRALHPRPTGGHNHRLARP